MRGLLPNRLDRSEWSAASQHLGRERRLRAVEYHLRGRLSSMRPFRTVADYHEHAGYGAQAPLRTKAQGLIYPNLLLSNPNSEAAYHFYFRNDGPPNFRNDAARGATRVRISHRVVHDGAGNMRDTRTTTAKNRLSHAEPVGPVRPRSLAKRRPPRREGRCSRRPRFRG